MAMMRSANIYKVARKRLEVPLQAHGNDMKSPILAGRDYRIYRVIQPNRSVNFQHPLVSAIHGAILIRVPFGSGVVGIKCFFVVTFVSVAHKLQHLRQI